MLPDDKLLDMLSSSYAQVRMMALDQLRDSNVTSPAILEVLEKLTHDSNPEVAEKAKQVLHPDTTHQPTQNAGVIMPGHKEDGYIQPEVPLTSRTPIAELIQNTSAIGSLESQSVNLYHSFWMIWIRPRQTIRRIADTNPNFFSIPGIILYAIVSRLPHQLPTNLNVIFNDALMVIVESILLYYLGSIVAWIGNMLGGKANTNLVRTSIVWALVPITIGMLELWILSLLTSDVNIQLISSSL